MLSAHVARAFTAYTAPDTLDPKLCGYCAREFTPRNRQSDVYCCRECNDAGRRERQTQKRAEKRKTQLRIPPDMWRLTKDPSGDYQRGRLFRVTSVRETLRLNRQAFATGTEFVGQRGTRYIVNGGRVTVKR